jgi:monodechloroaminopyrrolnitrin synthase
LYRREIDKLMYTQEGPGPCLAPPIGSLAEMLSGEAASNRAIADADPLGADEALLRLPALNERRDSEGIRKALEHAVARARSMPTSDYIQCSAAIRDLSMLGGSLVRLGIEPSDCVPAFGEVLMLLSAAADARIPRDSFIDYTSRNPANSRERTFTALPQERLFIGSLRRGMAALDTCLYNVMTACAYTFASEEFAVSFRSAADSFQIMIDAIVQVKRGITPEVFTHRIRPFFEPMRVGDTLYSAPSGAEMSILNIDQIIWGAECRDELYTTYFQANIVRLPEIYRQISQRFSRQKSLITLLKERLASGIPLSAAERISIHELHRLITRMYSFRMPHYRVAEDNVLLREREGGEGRDVKGSSGFGLVETKYVLDQTIQCRHITSMALAFGTQAREKV